MSSSVSGPMNGGPAAVPTPSAQVVGNVFVQQYYHILHNTPELVHRFYQDISSLGRPDPWGAMTCVTTQTAINDKILSMEYGGCRAEIKTVDAQDSLAGAVLVLVTGYLTGKDNVKRDFMQTFFLAPQDKGYFVLNDVFRYMGDADATGAPIYPGGVDFVPAANSPQVLEEEEKEAEVVDEGEEEKLVEEQPAASLEEEEAYEAEADKYDPSDANEGSVVEEEPPLVEEEKPVPEVIDEVPTSSYQAPVVPDAPASVIQEEAPKKSYASIVKAMKQSAPSLPLPMNVPARPAPSNPEWNSSPVPTPVSSTETSLTSSTISDSGSVQDMEADGHSIYIKNLPFSATHAQLEEEFKRFGPIKYNGIQVRSNKHGFCFGFVEYEVASSVQSAIEASPITIGGCQASVEEKRPAGSRVSNRGRFAPGRGSGFQDDGVRGRGGYGGGRGYRRGDFSNRTDFGNRGGGRGGNGHGNIGYQRVDHMGSNRGRGNRLGSAAPVNASQKNVVPLVPAPA